MSVPSSARTAVLLVTAASIALLPSAAFAGKPSGGSAKADRTAPTVAIAAPVAGATVTGVTTVKGSSGDNAGVARVEVSVDGGAYRAATGTIAWSLPVDTSALPDGSHSVIARATDTSGNTATTSVSFAVRNAAPDGTAPTLSIATPTTGAAVGRQIAVSGSAADAGGVARVDVRLDDAAPVTASGTGSWSAALDAVSDGPHVVTARATDTSGNVATTTVTVSVTSQAVAAPAMAAGTIGGFVFREADRDGMFETGETPLAGVYVYVYDASGAYVGKGTTDASGWFERTGLAPGTYSLQVAPTSWSPLRADWVPDTTGTVQPRRTVDLTTSARVDFGMRPIVRSTDAAAPLSTYTGPNGLTVKSYDDAVGAKQIYDHLVAGSLVGPEAADVTVRFDLVQSAFTSSMGVQSDGVYTDYRATSNLTWSGWLGGEAELFHEYGHAWSMYSADLVQQDPTLQAYLRARGLAGDPRLNSSYAWQPGEMIAEDYRELFGTAAAQNGSQINGDIPMATDVPGLRDFLAGTFRTARAG